MLYNRVALEWIHCFCISQTAGDVQQVQEMANSPRHANGLVSCSNVKAVWLQETMNGLQAANYLSHVTREGLDH